MPEENSATYTVRLDTEPVGGAATVEITGAADGIAPNPTRLVFTTRNWNTVRTVRVTAANDDNSSTKPSPCATPRRARTTAASRPWRSK